MRRTWLAASAALLLIGPSQGLTMSQLPAESQAVPDILDTETLAALDKMGTALRKLQSFTVSADTTDEKVLTTGQKVQFNGYVESKVQLPNKLWVGRVSDRQERILYYDGNGVTLYSPRMGFYGMAPATGTIHEVVAAIADKYDIETPLADLFTWGVDPSSKSRLRSAFYVGAQTIGGIPCDQYAMREEAVDWQVWLPQKGEALPCKLVITSTDEPSMPQYSAEFSWTPRQKHPPSTFAFVPPKGSRKIPLGKAPSETAAAE